MAATRIEWCNEVSNSFTGCKGPSGVPCGFCYARRMAHRLAGAPGTVYGRVRAACGDEFAPAFHADVWERAVERYGRRKKPRRIFVTSMGDVCFEGTAAYFDRLGKRGAEVRTREVQELTAEFAERCPQHTALVLTKRPDLLDRTVAWPSNVHLGVSLSRSTDAGRVDALHSWYGAQAAYNGIGADGQARGPGLLWASVEPLLDTYFDPECLAGLGWVVVGFQTGPHLDPHYPIHAVRCIRDWCADNKVPLFCKDSIGKVMPGSWACCSGDAGAECAPIEECEGGER
jgi:protein gp37